MLTILALLLALSATRTTALRAVFCNNNPAALQCPAGAVLDPTTAVFGRTDPSFTDCGNDPTGTTDCARARAITTVEQLCKGQNACTFDVNDALFGDPCAGVRKYLNVSYECVEPVSVGAMAVADGCEGTPVVLRCEAGAFVDVASATYGRLASTVDNCGFPDSGVTDCSQPGAGDVVVAACEGKTECTIEEVNNTLLGGDPCPGVKKVLEVKYRCLATPPMENVLCENKADQLSCSGEDVIKMTSATFGRSQKVPTCIPGRIDNTMCGRMDNVLSVLEDKCNGQSSCDVEAETTFFDIGDPCPGFRKYLNYTFECDEPMAQQQCGDLFQEGTTVRCFNTRMRLPSIQTNKGRVSLQLVSRRGKLVLKFISWRRRTFFKAIRASLFLGDQGALSISDLTNSRGSNFKRMRGLVFDPFALNSTTDCCGRDIYIYAYARLCRRGGGCTATGVVKRMTEYRCTDVCSGTLRPYSESLKCPKCVL